MHCDFAFFVGGTRENAHELPKLERLPGCAGIKVFMGSSTGALLVEDDDGVRGVLRAITRRRGVSFRGRGPSARAQDLARRGRSALASGLARRDRGALAARSAWCGSRARRGKRVHVLHVSTAEEMEFLAAHKDVASVEVTPHHLTLERPTVTSGSARCAQMNPPVRDASHRAGIWRGLAQGVVDVLGSDHAPHTREEKAKIYPASPSGMTGVQTLVPVMLDHVNAGRLTLQRFVDLTSAGPRACSASPARGASRSATTPISPSST